MPYSAKQMFDLVNQIEQYPDFLPWCASAQVLNRSESEVTASLVIARFGLRKTFTTCNQLEAPARMAMSLVDGPFNHLQGEWRFESLDEHSCQVVFEIEYVVSTNWIDKAFGSVFHQIANTMVDAFCKRAEAVYGK